MSWEEQVKSKMKITTGDGRVYEVLYLLESNTGSFEFNVTEFEFPEVAGTKVDRRLHKGTRYPLEFYFQGDDNIDQMKAFNESAKDTRPWVVLHPIYGSITAHPISVEFDNSGINTAKISVTIVETITDDGPRTVFDPRDNAPAVINKSVESNSAFFAAAVSPTVTDVAMMKANAENLYNEGSGSIGDQNIASQYFNLYNEAVTAINVSFNGVATGVTAIQDFIGYPALFAQSVQARLKTLVAQAFKLTQTLENITTPNEKKIYESQKGAVISAIITSSVTPFSDEYANAVDVISVIDIVLLQYNVFIEELQSLQTPDGTEQDSYLPDYQFMFDLNYAVNYAVSNLFNIALQAQQERVIYMESDSNIIIETHRFYGLLPDDSTLFRFISTNQIKGSEILQLKKGRRIVYYV